MYFGTDYYPEHWIYPYAGTPQNPEERWERDAELMAGAGMNVVRIGELAWGLFEPEEGKYDFEWMRRAMDVMHKHEISVVLATPTAAPPLWLAQKHPEILPLDRRGIAKREGTRRACCLNCDVYWDYSKAVIEAEVKALGDHPSLIAWQIDNAIGGHDTVDSFNEETRIDWHAWLKTKYESIENLNNMMGTRFWGQIVTDWSQIPMPWEAPTVHNAALELDWKRFLSDTIVAFVKMQTELLHEISGGKPVTTNLRALTRHFDHFDVAEALDFVSSDSNAALRSRPSESACDIDIMRCLKKQDVNMPGGSQGFWVIEQKAGHVDWQDVNSLVRPGIVRLFTYQQISRGADGILYFYWRQPRFGAEKFYGGVLTHDGQGDNRVYKEISQIGEEMKLLGPELKGTSVKAEACILYTHDNAWALQYPVQPNKHFSLKRHVQLFYNAFHDRNIPVDFARPTEDLSKYKLVIAPSLHLLAGGEADLLKLYVQNGGTLVGTFNTGLVDEHNIAPDTGYPHDLTDLFGLQIIEFDPLPSGEENHLIFKGAFPATHLHPARHWCDLIEPDGCQILACYAKDFYSGKPAMTINNFGLGKAIYLGTQSHQDFYYDLIAWLRQLCNVFPLIKVPDTVEVALRQTDNVKIYFLLNHQNTHVRIQFYKPMHDFLTGETIAGNYDLAPHGVLVLDERYAKV
ncbi:MAG: beta-galactosidase [Verrucomicrobia bacterium]|nr:beta-galactosidase [Verrucomicrobiota bacterium]